MAYKTVAVVGASGTLGKPLVQGLLDAGFKVTAVTRESSNAVFPDGIEVRRADQTSVGSLTKAFAGQDVVVMAIATSESGNQTPHIDAAVAAGVKRFIPAEWGFNTRREMTGPIKDMLGGKTKTVDYLIEKVKSHPELTWTGIATSSFFDWALNAGIYGNDTAAKTFNIFDSGNEPVSTSTLPFIAQSVVAVLQRPDQTANRYLEVVENNVTQNQLLALFEEETGAKFSVTHTKIADIAKERDEKIAKGDPGAVIYALWAFLFHDGANTAAKQEALANRELGLKGREVREIVREHLRAKGLIA